MPQTLRSRLIEWNNKFPLDREFRQKKGIVFGSKEHREVNQVDIYLQFLEDKLYEEFIGIAKDNVEKEKQLEKGIWLRENVLDDDTALDLFNKLNIADIPSDSSIQLE